MNRVPLAGGLAALVLGAAWLSLRPLPPGEPAPSVPLDAGRSGPAVPRAPAPELARNPFEYRIARDPAPEAAPIPTTPTPEPTPPPEAAEPTGPRLVGFIESGGQDRVVLSVDGEVSVAAVGEEVAGVRVVAIAPDQSVTLQGPDGARRVLLSGD